MYGVSEQQASVEELVSQVVKVTIMVGDLLTAYPLGGTNNLWTVDSRS